MKTTVHGFVQQRVDELNNEDHDAHKAANKIAVTLRLNAEDIGLLDRLCEELSLSRQAFLSGTIYGAMIDACNSLADMQPEKKRTSYYNKLIGKGAN